MESGRAGDEELARAIGLLRASGALDDTIARARTYAQRAIDALGPFPGGKAKSALIEAAEFAVARAY
jgi:octaprenyl-diphosphate synthase